MTTRPTTVILAPTLRAAEGYSRTLPQRHVYATTHYHAAFEGGLRGVGPGSTIHVLPVRVTPANAHLDLPDRLAQVLAPLETGGVVVVRPLDRSPRRRPTAARRATNRNRQPSKEER